MATLKSKVKIPGTAIRRAPTQLSSLAVKSPHE
jgi:hypothetical protein